MKCKLCKTKRLNLTNSNSLKIMGQRVGFLAISLSVTYSEDRVFSGATGCNQFPTDYLFISNLPCLHLERTVIIKFLTTLWNQQHYVLLSGFCYYCCWVCYSLEGRATSGYPSLGGRRENIKNKKNIERQIILVETFCRKWPHMRIKVHLAKAQNLAMFWEGWKCSQIKWNAIPGLPEDYRTILRRQS